MMDEKLKNIVEQGEGYYVEFKKGLSKDLAKEIVAFANASGGSIYLGINDDGTFSNLKLTNDLFSAVQNIANDCDPPVKIDLASISENILQVKVFSSDKKPHRCASGFYLRMGANAQKMKTDTILEFLEKEGRVRFDEQLNYNCPADEFLSSKAWEQFRNLAKINENIDHDVVLKSIGAIKELDGNKYLTNAGVLFFGNEITHFIPQSVVQCVVFKTNERNELLDTKAFEEGLLENIVNSLNFIARHINISTSVDKLESEEKWEIPQVALREAVVNAVIHRDYLEKGANVMIEVFPNKIRVVSPGGLPKGLSEKEFGKHSLARNAVLAYMMQRTPYMEKLGSGISRINQSLVEAGLPKANFSFDHFFTVKFDRKTTTQKTTQKTAQKTTQKTTQKLSDRQLEILQLISENPTITRKELSEKMDKITESGVKYNLKKLQDLKVLKRVGKTKGGYWKLIEK